MERAAGYNYLPAGVGDLQCRLPAIFDADCALSGEKDARGQSICNNRQIRTTPCGTQITDRGRAAAAFARGKLEVARSFLGRPIEIVVAWKTGLLRRLDESFTKRMWFAYVRYGERTTDPVECIGAALLVLGASEVGKYIRKAPTSVTELAPVIVILWLAANIEKSVDRT